MAKKGSAAVERVGISLEAELLEAFDELIEAKGYANRSEAVRDLIRGALAEERLDEPEAEAVAGVLIVYDHHVGGLTQKIMELQHSQYFTTISTMHVHLTHHRCMETIILRGKVDEIRKMADQLVSLKGVRMGKVSLMAV